MGDLKYEQRKKIESDARPSRPATTPGKQSLTEHEPAASRSGGTASSSTFPSGATPWQQRSRAFDRVFAFEPEVLAFDGAQAHQVRITNNTDEAQTIDEWELVGDSTAFETKFVGQRSIQLAPGDGRSFQVRFTQSDGQPHAAALVVRSAFNQREPARLTMSGISRGPATLSTEGCKTVSISPTTREGRANSITSALISVGAAWTAVLQQQTAGLNTVRAFAAKDPPMPTSGWQKVFDAALAEGLLRAVAAIVDHLSGGLSYAVWNVLQRLQLDASAVAAEKRVTALTASVHKALLSDFALSVTPDQIGHQREALLRDNVVPAALRDAFFDAQERTLSLAYADSVTTLTNSEGDYAALEAEHAGLGFAALDAYRQHLLCHRDRVIEIQRNKTLGLWAAFQARLALGTHEPGTWEKAGPGAALERNVYKATDDRHRLRGLARGVLELGVVWNYNERRTAPVAQIRHARVLGLQPELKEVLTRGPLGEFNMPLIVQGKVAFDSYAPSSERTKTTQLRIARNEGGAITLGAEAGTKGAEILDDLGKGDAYAGARTLLAYVDGLTLTSVE